ncbi:MAG: dimethylsulfoniopropionate demethylase [Halieaceae bacterium]|jgi:glycine cleavage system aminomethyltransferase T|nr:dimethylsulfoniopropionate demethylase [Halieaceae bacterium]
MNQQGNIPQTSFGSRVRKSPFFESTRRWGCNTYTVYNHTYMPVSYGDSDSEYRQLLEHVTLWDVACERQVQVKGPDASRFTQLLTPRDLTDMAVGQAKYVPVVNEQGGMINDPLLLRVSEDCYWFSLADSDVLLWAKGVAVGTDYRVEITEPDVSPLQIQGPAATDVVQALFGDSILDLKYFWFEQMDLDGIPLVLSRTGWSNERGYELFLQDGSRGDELWEKIMAAGKPFNISPACPSQTKRMEAGLLSYGNDLDQSLNPLEVGMDKFVDLDKPIDFIGKQALQKIAETGITRKLMGAVIEGDALPVNEHRWPVYVDDRRVGELTSCVYSPSMESNIAYIIMPFSLAAVGQSVSIDTADGLRKAKLCQLPFVVNRAR